MVYATGDQETFFTAVEPGKSGGSVEITVGQQTNKYPTELLVGKDIVLKAAKLFTETGKLEPNVHWRSTEEVEASSA